MISILNKPLTEVITTNAVNKKCPKQNSIQKILLKKKIIKLKQNFKRINCSPGFFGDVFTFLQSKTLEDLSYKYCALLFDSMHILAAI